MEVGNWDGLRMGRNAPVISHSFFTDDCLLFVTDNVEGVETLLQVLHDYEFASGQKINYQKSSVFFSKYMFANRKAGILTKLGMVGNEGTGRSKK